MLFFFSFACKCNRSSLCSWSLFGNFSLDECTFCLMIIKVNYCYIYVEDWNSFCCACFYLVLVLSFNGRVWSCLALTPKGGWVCLMSSSPFPSPFWKLRAVIWFRFTTSSLVLLPSPVTLSVLFHFCLLAHSPYFFSGKFFNIFSFRDRLFCVAPV